MRRKGELSSHRIDSEWPHQVALRADLVSGSRQEIVEKAKRELGAGDRGHALPKKRKPNAFRERLGGEPFNPKDRGRGASWVEVG